MVPTRPFLGVVVAQDLRLDVRWGHHGALRSVRVVANTAATAIAATQEPLTEERRAADGRTNDSAMIARRGRSAGDAASLAIASEPAGSRSSGGDGGEP